MRAGYRPNRGVDYPLFFVVLFSPACSLSLDGWSSTSSTSTSTGATVSSSSEDTSLSSNPSTLSGTTDPHPQTTTGTTGSASDTASANSSSHESSDTATTSASSCGDGLLDLETEECDDANIADGDACSSSCFRQRYAFLSSKEFAATDLSGVFADQRCQTLAEQSKAMGLLPSGTSQYHAWISTADQPAKARHTPGKYRYVNVLGQVIAKDWEALAQGDLDRALDTTELGETFGPALVWTGTLASGDAAGETCKGWTSMSGDDSGRIGSSAAKDSSWTDFVDVTNPAPCELLFRIYCLEQGKP